MKKISDVLFSSYLMGSLVVLFAVSIAVATFIENDFGAAAARATVYNARWFELLLLILVINVTGMVFRVKLYGKKKISIFTFHIAFLVILTGAAFTRYLGFEGIMHIREGFQTNQILSQNIYFKANVKGDPDEDSYLKNMRLTAYFDEKFSTSAMLSGNKYQFELEEVISNATEAAIPDSSGDPILNLVAFGKDYQYTLLIKEGETKKAGETKISFNDVNAIEGIQIRSEDTLLWIRFPEEAATSSMMGGEGGLLEKELFHAFEKRRIYRMGEMQLVLSEVYDKAVTKWVSTPPESHNTGIDLFTFKITSNGETERVNLAGQINLPGERKSIEINGNTIELSYGKVLMNLPFFIQLEDFQIERYPGSNSPSSFASEVTLIDQERNIEKPFRVYMNNILKHQGYRFYQSSYDPDEKGTILSVNRDSMGTFITYIGYFILVFGILWSIINRNSRFRSLARMEVAEIGKRTGLFLGLFLGSVLFGNVSIAQTPDLDQPEDKIISYSHSKKFGELLIQDNNGRIKPLNTLASDVMHKVTKKEKYMGYHPTQMILGMLSDPGYWQTVPIIKIGNPNLATAIGVSGKYASFMDFLDMTKRGEYKIRTYVDEAYSKSAGKRDKFDKEVIAVDERVNICYMLYTETRLDIFPAQGDPNNTWFSPEEAFLHVPQSDSLFIKEISQLYFQSILESIKSDNWEMPNEYLNAILTYQYRHAETDLPSKSQVKMEMFYNNFNIFKKLFPFYSLLGITLLLLLIIKILFPGLNIRHLTYIIIIHLAVGFFAHTFALGIRWYISGHAPWSNGYESMIYVAWATMLAGFIFARKSLITLSVTAVLASLTLLVAHFSWMNPEITNLVPVLQSYWLTFHVSIITASYGFLGLGALLGMLNLVLILLKNPRNRGRIENQIQDLTRINEMTLILGLYFLTVGTILGAVWANESWGRYWGWDPKETWSLVTILVYTFITHMRQIPGLRSNYSFNLSSLVGFSSVLMTYFGVNYYLSGLHSYAQGDPVPVPKFVYYLVITIFLMALFAYSNEKRFKMQSALKE